MKVKSESEVAQSRPTLCDPMDCSLPVFSVHGIFQARILEEKKKKGKKIEYWNGLPFPSPREIPDPEIEAGSPTL